MIITIDVLNDNFTITGVTQYRWFDNIKSIGALTPGVHETIDMMPEGEQCASKMVIQTDNKVVAVILPLQADAKVFLDNGDTFDEF